MLTVGKEFIWVVYNNKTSTVAERVIVGRANIKIHSKHYIILG